MKSKIQNLLRDINRDRRGAVAVMMGVAAMTIMGMSAFVVDIGNVTQAQRSLQRATDVAALAGARDINCCSTGGKAVTTANSYSATAGNKNVISGLTVTMASGYPKLKCLTSTGISCSGSDSANAIQVKQSATVPLYFGAILGLSSVNISATATAGVNGGAPQSLDVMLVLDTTQSMNNSDSNCTVSGISHPTRLDCALNGVRSLLSGLWPTVDQVGLMVFPGVTNSTSVGREYDCASSPDPSVAAYNANPIYKIISLSSDYRTSNTAATLNTASNLVKTARGGASNCAQGLEAIGGVGTYFADAITAAQTELTTNGRSGVQKVIILLSDGDASASSGDIASTKRNNQCAQAVTAAQSAANAGTWVFSIAYGASTSSTGSCSTDSPHISACSTMQQIASDDSKFYSDTYGSSTCTSTANPVTDLNEIFKHIGTGVTSARLLSDGTT